MFGLMGVARNGGQGASVPDQSAAIIALFGSGEKGWLYDFNDLTTFYSDDALTAAATVNGAVGGIRDKSPNLLHAKQVTATARATLRGTPTGANLWTAYGTPGAGWVNSGSGVATATASSAAMPTTTAATIGRVYRVVYTMTRTAGTLTPSMGGVTLTASSAAGTYEQWITASSTAVLTFTGTGYSGAVSAVSVRDASADAVTAPYALQSDGVDDFYVTASCDLSGTDKIFWCYGVKRLDSVIDKIIVEHSTNYASGAGRFISGTAASGRLTAGLTGTLGSTAYQSNTSGINNVMAAQLDMAGADRATEVFPYLNGTLTQTNPIGVAAAGTGNLASQPIYFCSRAGTSSFAAILLAGSMGIGRALTSDERALVTAWQTARLPT